MPGTTSTYLKIEYPLPSDRIADYPATGRALAEHIETIVLGKNPGTGTLASGWTGTFAMRKIGALVELRVNAKHSGNYSPGTWQIGTLPPVYWPPATVSLPASNVIASRAERYKPDTITVDDKGVVRFYTSAYGESVEACATYMAAV